MTRIIRNITGSGVDSSVPFFIPSGTTFYTLADKQSLAAMSIDAEGVIDVSDGILIFVN